MDEKQQQTAFANDLQALLDRYLHEFDMTFASMSGVLFCFATRTVIDSYMNNMAETILEDYELVDEDEDEEDEYEDEYEDEDEDEDEDEFEDGDEWKSADGGD